MLLLACARIKPSVRTSQGRKLNELSRQAKSPARAAEMKVMIRTAARVEISHFEMTSSWSHSAFETSGMTLSALRHIAKFISHSLKEIHQLTADLATPHMRMVQVSARAW